jgi:hypothetical protein
MYEELTNSRAATPADLLPSATDEDGGLLLCARKVW